MSESELLRSRGVNTELDAGVRILLRLKSAAFATQSLHLELNNLFVCSNHFQTFILFSKLSSWICKILKTV